MYYFKTTNVYYKESHIGTSLWRCIMSVTNRGIARFFGVWGQKSQWQPLSEITNFKKVTCINWISFYWLNNLKFVGTENQLVSFKIFIALPLGLDCPGRLHHSPLPTQLHPWLFTIHKWSAQGIQGCQTWRVHIDRRRVFMGKWRNMRHASSSVEPLCWIRQTMLFHWTCVSGLVLFHTGLLNWHAK